jgi:hypothetical protein
MTRTTEHLQALHTKFQEIFDITTQLVESLQKQGPTKPLLSWAKDRIDPRTNEADLRRWHRMSSHAVAVDILSIRLKRSPKAIRDQVALGEKVVEIEDAWTSFGTYLRQLPKREQQRIEYALAPFGSRLSSSHPDD